MPKVTLPHNPELQPEQVLEVVQRQLGGKYQFRPSNARFVDFWVFPSEWKGASVRLKQKPDKQQTTILVYGNAPSLWARLALVAIIWAPLLYVQLVAARPVVNDVVNAIETSPELRGEQALPPAPSAQAAEAAASPPPPPPPPPPPASG